MSTPAPPHTTRSRGYLPHWEAARATYAITFRLGDSLPQYVLDAYRRERSAILETAAAMQRELSPLEHARLAQLYDERIDSWLDQGQGACHLRNRAIGQMVFDALGHFHPIRYTLFTWCIMPNHVHALFQPAEGHKLETIMHSWKSFTSKEANRMLQRSGPFWMAEYYDHLIRDASDFAHAHRYILNNPGKAGLKNWPWCATFLDATQR